MINKLSKYYHTIRHLKWTQIKYQLYYRLRSKVRGRLKLQIRDAQKSDFQWIGMHHALPSSKSFLGNNTFEFLNISKQFDQINWNEQSHGMLWNYNLNYFDWLGQPDLDQQDGIRIIHDFIDHVDNNENGLAPYPTSLRLINWIKYVSKYQVSDTRIDQYIGAQADYLLRHLEYHLLANHLLENAFALLFAAVYLKDETIFSKAKEIFDEQLQEQILDDGAHFELSTMYHCIILNRVLESYELLKSNKTKFAAHTALLALLSTTSTKMINWLYTMTKELDEMPLLNDAANGITHSPDVLLAYANDLGLEYQTKALSESGYRRMDHGIMTLIADVGVLGPDYQLGHAHADSLHFVLYIGGKPIIVDSGTSTYDPGMIRNRERSTAAHNTVSIDEVNSSQIWSSFRVAQRAKTKILDESPQKITSEHNGYQNVGVTHRRKFSVEPNTVIVSDEMIDQKDGQVSTARLHFHPDCQFVYEDGRLIDDNISIQIVGAQSIRMSTYDYAPRWNTWRSAQVCEIDFKNKLTTEISVTLAHENRQMISQNSVVSSI